MNWSEIEFHPSRRKLRQFAALWLLFLSAAALWQNFFRGQAHVAGALALIAVLIGGIGLIEPSFVRPIFVGWMIVAFPIGWVISRLALALLFYGIFTPLAFFFRMKRRDLLNLRRQENRDSYWTTRAMPADVRRYFEQS